MSPDKIALKVATRAMVRAVGGFEAAALHCRVGKSLLHRQCDPNDDSDSFVALDVIADLEPLGRGSAGWPHVTRARAKALGFELVSLDFARDGRGEAMGWAAFCSELAKEAGDIVSGLCGDLTTGNDVSPTEARKRLSDADELVSVAVRIRAALQARAEEGQ